MMINNPNSFLFQIASVALCLLTGCYKHAADLVVIISEQEVTLEMLAELDRLVQLIESPIFTCKYIYSKLENYQALVNISNG